MLVRASAHEIFAVTAEDLLNSDVRRTQVFNYYAVGIEGLDESIILPEGAFLTVVHDNGTAIKTRVTERLVGCYALFMKPYFDIHLANYLPDGRIVDVPEVRGKITSTVYELVKIIHVKSAKYSGKPATVVVAEPGMYDLQHGYLFESQFIRTPKLNLGSNK